MSRIWMVPIMAVAGGAIVLAGVQGAAASSGPSVRHAPASSGIKHWVGTWRGKASETPEPPPPAPQNPYKITVFVKSVTKSKVGTVRYPSFNCDYSLRLVSVTHKRLVVQMVLTKQGPYDCVSSERAVMSVTAKGAHWRGIYDGSSVETGWLRKAK